MRVGENRGRESEFLEKTRKVDQQIYKRRAKFSRRVEEKRRQQNKTAKKRQLKRSEKAMQKKM